MTKSKIGIGYSTDKQSELGTSCIMVEKGDIISTGNGKSMMVFNGVTSYTEVAMELGVDLSVHAKVGIVDVNVGEEFTHYVKDTDYSKSFIFKIGGQLSGSKLKIKKYGEELLTTSALKMHKDSVEDFVNTCGDKFIAEEHPRVSLYISTKLEFITRYEKDTFSVDNGWLLGPIMSFLELTGGQLNYIFEQKRASLSISILQNGGDVGLIQKTVSELGINKNGLGSYDCMQGTKSVKEKIAYCKEIMNKLLGYGTDVFPKSVSSGEVHWVDSNTYKISYTTIGLDISSYKIPDWVVKIRQHLKLLYEDYMEKQAFINKLFTPVDNRYMEVGDIQVGFNISYIPGATQADLKMLNSSLGDAITQIKSYDTTCYDKVNECIDYNPTTDFSLIDIFRKAYAIRSKCSSDIYGPRYIFAIEVNEDTVRYREDSKIKGASNMTIMIDNELSVSKGNNENEIKILCNNGFDTLSRDTSHSYIHAYAGHMINCFHEVCPSGVVDTNTLAELILTNTLI